MSSRLTLSLSLMCLLALAACTPTGTPGSAPASNQPTPAPQAQAASAAPIPAAAEGASANPAQRDASAVKKQPYSPVSNPSFEMWTDGVPNGWNISEGAGDKWEQIAFRQSTTPNKGKYSIELPPPGEGKQVILAQNLDALGMKSGEKFVVSAMAKVPEAGQFFMVVSYLKNGEKKKAYRYHAGGPEWQKIQLLIDESEGLDPKSVRVEFVRPVAGPDPVLLDDVVLYYIKPENS